MNRPLPANEEQRCKELEGLCLLDTPAEERFDRLTRLARHVFRVPYSAITLLHKDRQWFKSAQGHLIPETPRADSFCQYTIMQDEFLVVEDATTDERFADLPSVAHMGLRFYAGAPVQSRGQRVGTLCIFDTKPRGFTLEDRDNLQDLASCVESEIQLASLLKAERELHSKLQAPERMTATDPVTRSWGEQATLSLLRSLRSEESPNLAVLLLEMHKVDTYRESHGDEAVDLLLRTAAERIRSTLKGQSCMGRLAENRFLVMFPELPAQSGEAKCQGVLTRLAMARVRYEGRSMGVEASAGLAFDNNHGESDESLLTRLEKALSRASSKGPGTLTRAF